MRIVYVPLGDKRRKSDISPLLENYATYSISTFTEESASMIRVLREMNVSPYFERNESARNVNVLGTFPKLLKCTSNYGIVKFSWNFFLPVRVFFILEIQVIL